jgi:hypothetical protein
MLKTCPDCNGDGAIDKDTDNEREQATAFVRWREIVACDMVKAHWPHIQLVAGQLLVTLILTRLSCLAVQ